MFKHIEYTRWDDRSSVWEGKFEGTNDINVGDLFLTHHTCKYCHKPVVQKVVRKKLAYTYEASEQSVKVYDFIVEGGSSYKSNLKLVSTFDRRVSDCECTL